MARLLISNPTRLDRRRGRHLCKAIAAIMGILALISTVWMDIPIKIVNSADASMQASTLTPVPQGFLGGEPVTSNQAWAPTTQVFNGVEMVLVPVGCFMMGSNTFVEEEPIHEQCFEEPFWIDKYEVTNTQFASFGGESEHASWWNIFLRPRENITWYEARAFCEEKRGGWLPTEREWEYAARGPDAVIYPWGNEFAENVVYTDNSGEQTAEVGRKPDGSSWVGALDMSGNVWEWTSTIYRFYPYTIEDGRENRDFHNTSRVIRGGSFENAANFLRAAYRNWNYQGLPNNTIGFRCARAWEQ
jgi:formylglycine-generating enzyme required for sulfatase activity